MFDYKSILDHYFIVLKTEIQEVRGYCSYEQ
jgi:hypothetical protein